MDPAIRDFVRRRSDNCCEYCRVPEPTFLTFHVEHIRARQHGGTDEPENLALACPDCNAFKGPNLVAIDPFTEEMVPIYNPRLYSWGDHFDWDGAFVVGRTPIGRATVRLLNMNEFERVEMRADLKRFGEM